MTAAILLMLAPMPLAAALHWESKEISLEAGLGDTEKRTAFVYRNTGQDPVTILAVRSNCGCTAAIADDPIVLPGETGKIDVHFTFSDRIGPQRITTRVRTDSPNEPDTTLTLRVNIPTAITASPRAIVWKLPDAPPPVTLSVHPSITVKSIKATPGDYLEATITPIKDPKTPNTFTLQFKPSDDFQSGRFAAPVTVTSENTEGEDVEYSITVRLLARN